MSSDVSRFTLEALVRQCGLHDDARRQLESLIAVLAEDPTAPTTVTEPAQAVDVHLADALDALELDVVRQAHTIADIGAGAGIPGLVLAAALPEARVSLIESVGKKCDFMARAAATAGIANASVINARAEEWAAGLAGNDIVTARALAPLGVLIEYAAPLLRDGGSLVAWKGEIGDPEALDAAAAAAELGMEAAGIHRQPQRPGATSHHLHVYLKVRATPERFPRRAGMARKRPITA